MGVVPSPLGAARLTWVIVGAVSAVFVVAGIDALRSPDKPTVAATTAETSGSATLPGSQGPACTRQQTAISITARRYRDRWNGTLLVQRHGESACRQLHSHFRVAISDAAGKRLGVWSGEFDGATVDLGARFAAVRVPCDRPGPLLALVTVGLNPDPQGRPFRTEVKCFGSQ
jgi:hypothetical protein